MRAIEVLSLVALALSFASCGNDKDKSSNNSPSIKHFSGSLGSCNITGAGACVDFSYTAMGSTDPLSGGQFEMQRECYRLFGSYSRSTCDRTGAVAFCSYTVSSPSLSAVVRGVTTYTAPSTVSSSQVVCAKIPGSTFSTTAP